MEQNRDRNWSQLISKQHTTLSASSYIVVLLADISPAIA
jgi:hypothetical protein